MGAKGQFDQCRAALLICAAQELQTYDRGSVELQNTVGSSWPSPVSQAVAPVWDAVIRPQLALVFNSVPVDWGVRGSSHGHPPMKSSCLVTPDCHRGNGSAVIDSRPQTKHVSDSSHHGSEAFVVGHAFPPRARCLVSVRRQEGRWEMMPSLETVHIFPDMMASS